jgi:hypothetical protein
MASPFAGMVAAAELTVAAVFGERLRLIPRDAGDPNARNAADPSRPTIEVAGEFNEPSSAARPQGRGIANSNTHGMVRQQPSATLHGVLAWIPVKGDRLERVETGRLYEIAEVHRVGYAITRLELVT